MSIAGTRTAFAADDGGAPPRHIDACTARLDMLARSWLDVQQTRLALAQRELDASIVEAFASAETKLSTTLTRTLRTHTLWPWLAQFPGLGGAHVGLVIGRIGDPRRYPGQRCSEGHYLPPLYTPGSPCPIAESRPAIESGPGAEAEHAGTDERTAAIEALNVCPGVLLSPRTTTGVRSLWHWAGLHADENGRAPRRRKGVQADWEPRVRTSVMQPGGIADQIVRSGIRNGTARHVYAQRYIDAKAQLLQRVTEAPIEIDVTRGRPLRLHEADRIARKVAAKAFLGDLLTTWKQAAA